MGTFIFIIVVKIIVFFVSITKYFVNIGTDYEADTIEFTSTASSIEYSLYCVLYLFLFGYFHYLAVNNHYYEYKERRIHVVLYATYTLLLYVLLIIVHLSRDLFLTKDKPDMGLYWEIYYIRVKVNVFQRFGISLVIILFKKSQDIFSCFSRVNDITKITIF